jgi:hypothetical protein
MAAIVATAPGGGVVTDQSTDGIDPDADGDDTDGSRDDDGIPDEDDPTPVSFAESPLIGIAKAVGASPAPTGTGSYQLTYSIIIENFGDVDLADLQVSDDLAAAFDAVVSWSVVSAASDDLSVSPTFDGVADTDLLVGGDVLVAGAAAAVNVTVSITPGAALGPHWNTATVAATSPAGTTVADISQDGTEPDPDGNGNPTDNNEPTPVSFPALGAVTGIVWQDIDANGDRSEAEAGFEGVAVALVDPGPDGLLGTGDDVVMATTETDDTGSYAFLDVNAGNYTVVVDTATLPPGVQATFDPDGTLDHSTPVTVLAGQSATDNDFGYVLGFNLWLDKTAAGGRQIGERLDYIITVGNDGPGAAFGPIVIRDNVPVALPVTAASGPGWDCSFLGQAVECVWDGDLGPGAESSVLISTAIAPSAGGDIVNTADVAATGPIVELDLTDNVDAAIVAVGELPHTGSDLLRFAVIGLILLLVGVALVAMANPEADPQDHEALT